MLLAQTNISDFWNYFSDHKEAFAGLESLAKVAGIVAAGCWAWHHFKLKREKYPRCSLEQNAQMRDFSADEWHLRVNLNIKNESAVLMSIKEGHTWVQQLEPCPQDAVEEFKERNKLSENESSEAESAQGANSQSAPYEVRWPLIDERLHNKEMEFEPGEISEVPMDFFIKKYYTKILVYSFIENSAKPGRHIGWTASTIVDFRKPGSGVVDEGQRKGVDKPRPEDAKY